MQIENSVILITGGSSGLGAASVHRLANLGAKVIVADLSPPHIDWSSGLAERIVFLETDVTEEDAVRESIAEGQQQFGPLRGLVHCAGVLSAERVLNKSGPASLEEFRRVIEVNLTGTFNTVRLAAEAIAKTEPMEEGERGTIIMTSSVAAFEGQIGQTAYSASKGAVAAMTLPLARDLASRGIRVVSIAPGVFETPMMAAAPEKVRQSLIAQAVFPQRLGRPDEFASLAAHIFENRMLNGCIVRLDGAVRMGPR